MDTDETRNVTDVRGNEGLLYGDVTHAIIGSAMEVHRELGWGFLEKVYSAALCIELRNRGLSFETEVRIPVEYKGTHVGLYIADIVVEGKVLCELKVSETLIGAHTAQLLNYLKATDMRLGMLLNFGARKLEFQRLVN